MSKENNIPWNEISSFLKEEADQAQKDTIKAWLNASEENPGLLREIVSTWQLTRSKPQFYKPDEDFLWKKLVSGIGQRQQRKIVATAYSKWIAAAAVLCLVFLTGTWFGTGLFPNRSAQPVYSTIVVPPGSRTQTILPDGTKVWLNSGAKLRYPTDFSSASREVYTSGECYFEVAKDAKHRFTVHSSGLCIQVFGTTFNVKENADGGTIVSLIEGKVKVTDPEERMVASLSPGKQLVFSNGKGAVRDAANLPALTSWINNSLVFENQPLHEVISYLEGWYGVRISLDSELNQSRHRYTFKIKTESLREVLDMISVITPVTYKVEGEDVSIKYK